MAMGRKEGPRKNRTPRGIPRARGAAAAGSGGEVGYSVASGSKQRAVVVMTPEGTARGFPVGMCCCKVKMRRSSRWIQQPPTAVDRGTAVSGSAAVARFALVPYSALVAG